jgi:uncharacterized protein YjbI with pentapeptide repeats
VKKRGERRARPNWSAVTTVLEGEITGPVVDFTDIAPPQSSPLRNCGMFEVRAHGVDVDLDSVHLTVAWSEFDDCTFRQRRRTSYDGVWPQGSFGTTPATYRNCVFHGVRFRILGGFSVGQARFEGCTFRHCKFNGLFAHCADFVHCTFEGKVSGAVFYAEAPSGQPCRGKVNEIVHNDFTAAQVTNVGWRGGVNVEAQLWPHGYVPDTDS